MATYTAQQLYDGVDGPNLTAGTTYTFTLSNVIDDISYFTMETKVNSDEVYDASSPKNLEGTFVMGAGTSIINDDYIGGVIVPEGNSSFTFTPDNNVVSSTWRVLGTGNFSVTIS